LEIMESGATLNEVDIATTRMPPRLERNLGKLDAWVKSQVNAPALAQEQLTCAWPTCAVVAGDVMQVIYALETAFVIRKEGEGNAYLIPDGVLFPDQDVQQLLNPAPPLIDHRLEVSTSETRRP